MHDVRALCGSGHAVAIFIAMRACNECHLSTDLLGGGLPYVS